MSVLAVDFERLGLTHDIRWSIARNRPFKSTWLIGYITKGGTYTLASASNSTDSGQPRDLIAVLPGDLGHGRALALYIGTNPEFVAAVEQLVAA